MGKEADRALRYGGMKSFVYGFEAWTVCGFGIITGGKGGYGADDTMSCLYLNFESLKIFFIKLFCTCADFDYLF